MSPNPSRTRSTSRRRRGLEEQDQEQDQKEHEEEEGGLHEAQDENQPPGISGRRLVARTIEKEEGIHGDADVPSCWVYCTVPPRSESKGP